jgi:uncharacterized protein with LGFP repeats
VATFDRWGDGNTDRVRTLTLPDADQTLTVSYRTPIDRRYASDAALRTMLGNPTDVEQGNSAVRWRAYTGGRLYWSPATDVHAMRGGILTRYLAGGGHLKYGLPLTDEVADGAGRYNLLFGYQAIYWYPGNAPVMVGGDIYKRYKAMGAQRSVLGYPTTDELVTGNKLGRYNHFQHGSVFWSSATGAWPVVGAIRTKWAQLGWERSYLGFPTSNEFAVSGGVRQNYQHGYITYISGRATDHRY